MGLLDSVIEAAKQQYQTTKRGFGLLASNPQQFAQEATTRYFPTKEEEAQFAQAQAAGGDYTQTPYYQKVMDLGQFQGSIKPTGLLDNTFNLTKNITDPIDKVLPIEVLYKPESKFLYAKNNKGLVGGHIENDTLRITTAEVEEASRGKGIGTALYKKLIDDALSKGMQVVSDSTVEAPAVRVYESLKKQGYDVKRLNGGKLEDGSVYGIGANNPAFKIINSPKQKK